jgi:hypothetical protein
MDIEDLINGIIRIGMGVSILLTAAWLGCKWSDFWNNYYEALAQLERYKKAYGPLKPKGRDQWKP